MCGSGVGTFIFAPLASYLVETFGWKGANLIFAALCLQCAVRRQKYCVRKFKNTLCGKYGTIFNQKSSNAEVRFVGALIGRHAYC